MTSADAVVLRFGQHRSPRSNPTVPTVDVPDPAACLDTIDDVVASAARVLVIGADGDLATVLTRTLRAQRLEVEIAHLSGPRGVRRALSARAQRVPLIRDETGRVLVGQAQWLAPAAGELLKGEAIVDDTVLFDGAVTGVQIEPLAGMPGLRARVLGSRWRRGPWVSGRAAQLGTPGAIVVRDGVPVSRPVRRSTFYRHVEGWLRVG